MYSKTFVSLALLSLIQADLSGPASTVSSLAQDLASLVTAFDGKAISGALAIQESYDPFSSAVAALDTAAGSATSADITEGLVGTLAAITDLLDALTSKASAFAGVGASQIVTGDINGLSQPAGDIVSKLAKVGSSEELAHLADGVSSLAAAFTSAASAYSASAPTFPDLGAGSGSESSAAASSGAAVESSAAAASSGAAVESSAAAVTTSAPAAAGNGTGAATVTDDVTVFTTYCPEPTTFVHGNSTYTVTEATTLTITDCGCTAAQPPATHVPSSSAPAVANGAAVVALGAAPFLAAAVALL